MVRIADGKGVGERVVIGDIAARQMCHRGRPLFGTHWSYLPLFQAACVAGPVVRQILEELQARDSGAPGWKGST